LIIIVISDLAGFLLKLQLTVSIKNVGQLISTIISVYYLAVFVKTHRPFGLAQTPYVFYTLLAVGVLFICSKYKKGSKISSYLFVFDLYYQGLLPLQVCENNYI
jgi:hypothetical protein